MFLLALLIIAIRDVALRRGCLKRSLNKRFFFPSCLTYLIFFNSSCDISAFIPVWSGKKTKQPAASKRYGFPNGANRGDPEDFAEKKSVDRRTNTSIWLLRRDNSIAIFLRVKSHLAKSAGAFYFVSKFIAPWVSSRIFPRGPKRYVVSLLRFSGINLTD